MILIVSLYEDIKLDQVKWIDRCLSTGLNEVNEVTCNIKADISELWSKKRAAQTDEIKDLLSTKQARRKIDQTGKRENQPNRQKTLEKENGQIFSLTNIFGHWFVSVLECKNSMNIQIFIQFSNMYSDIHLCKICYTNIFGYSFV